jgi:hypothetical protein
MVGWSLTVGLAGGTEPAAREFTPLFSSDALPEGWVVRRWDDVSQPPAKPTSWKVENGVLHGSPERGTWIMSKDEYTDFVLEFDFKLGEVGNSGLALRSPMKGDPAFDGMELQMVDFRYNPKAKDSELTGGLYRAVAPTKQVYKPTEWNHYEITLVDSHLNVKLNGEVIQDIDLDEQQQRVKRHDGTDAPPIKDRPKKGHIGFQELGKANDRVQIRNARIKVLK